jgi:hypothetical protein
MSGDDHVIQREIDTGNAAIGGSAVEPFAATLHGQRGGNSSPYVTAQHPEVDRERQIDRSACRARRG